MTNDVWACKKFALGMIFRAKNSLMEEFPSVFLRESTANGWGATANFTISANF